MGIELDPDRRCPCDGMDDDDDFKVLKFKDEITQTGQMSGMPLEEVGVTGK